MSPFGPPFAPPAPPGFPVYPVVWHPVRTRMTVDRSPAGRLIGVEYTWDYQPSEAEFQAELGSNDVVWLPLYQGTIDQTPRRRDAPRAERAANLRALADLGPRVRAVLVGNANGEICYDCNLRANHRRCLEFVRRHGPLVAPHARPAFAPVFDILVEDCYRRGGELRDEMNRLGALVIAFAGSQWLFEKADPWIPEPPPRPRLADYLASMEAWSGVGLLRGLEAGSGAALQAMGFRAGIMGYF
ncbi:MAG: hypothetical protein NT029_11410 [Armatimonadetes bacterium]|nr:hypothetical protein [Armatimonadota bacterium]